MPNGTNSVAPISLAELLYETPRRGDWGPWRLDTASYVVFIPIEAESESDDHADGSRYWIDLESCLTSPSVLDWIMQVAAKNWADDRTLAGLVRALDDLLHPQGTLCSWGQPSSLTLAEVRQRVHEVAKWEV